jgi:hypothetical protein
VARPLILLDNDLSALVAPHLRRTRIASCIVRYLRNTGGKMHANSCAAGEEGIINISPWTYFVWGAGQSLGMVQIAFRI